MACTISFSIDTYIIAVEQKRVTINKSDGIGLPSIDREAGFAQGIQGTCFEHPLTLAQGDLRPLGKHYRCHSFTV